MSIILVSIHSIYHFICPPWLTGTCQGSKRCYHLPSTIRCVRNQIIYEKVALLDVKIESYTCVTTIVLVSCIFTFVILCWSQYTERSQHTRPINRPQGHRLTTNPDCSLFMVFGVYNNTIEETICQINPLKIRRRSQPY